MYKNILFSGLLLMLLACDDDKSRFPEFQTGVSYRPLPSPWTARPRLSKANPSTPISFEISSANPDDIAKVEIYVSYLPNTNMPTGVIAANTTYANAVGPVLGTAAIAEVPDSGRSPVTIDYTRYNQLVNGVTTAVPPVTFTAIPRILLRNLTADNVLGTQSFTLDELVTATGATLPATISATVSQQPSFLFTFEVTDVNGAVFSYKNGSPGINANPPTGRVATRVWVDPADKNNKKNYEIILSGNEGSPFVPGASIRVAP